MSVRVAVPTRTRPSRLVPPRPSLPDANGVAFGVVGILSAALAIYLLSHGQQRIAFALAFLPIGLWFVARPALPIVLLGASLPWVVSLSGASAGGLSIAASDLLMTLLVASVVVGAASALRPVELVRTLRPVQWPVVAYTFAMAVIIPFHASVHEVLQVIQRLELYLVPLVLGVYSVSIRRHEQLLKAYVISCTALAAIFPFRDFGMQHNPEGQFVANAILLVIAVRALRGYWPCLAVLVPSLIRIESRGAIVGLVVGVLVLLLVQRVDRPRMWARVIPLAIVAAIAFLLAPASVRDRLTTFSSGFQSNASINLSIRHDFAHDAHRIIRAHRWTGVGIGNYGRADVALLPAPIYPTDDPHEVLLLQEAEGGYLFAAAFLLLIVGTAGAMWKMRQVELAAVAAAVLSGTAVHGLVDVYWVRGTPVLAWLLVGMVCAQYTRLGEAKSS
jgi:hypothetical protein